MTSILVLIFNLQTPTVPKKFNFDLAHENTKIKPTSTKIYKNVPTPWIKIAKNSN